MSFKRYEKIHALHKEECEGILNGACYVQEKIDGANTSIWVGEEGGIRIGSRNNDVTEASPKGKQFGAFREYVASNCGIKELLSLNPTWRLYGEWLSPHTIKYNTEAYNKWYIFDIETEEGFLPIDKVNEIAYNYGILTPYLFGEFKNLTIEKISELAGKSFIGEKGEGVIIKNFSFTNKFGRNPYAKYVTEEFKEEASTKFGNNNKASESYDEIYIANKYVTLSRVKKIISKLETEEDRSIELPDIPKISGLTYYDMLTEEIWEIAKTVKKIDFKSLKNICTKKTANIVKDIVLNFNSVAYENNNN